MSKYGLSKRNTKKTSREFLDFDYLAKLSPAEREWLAKFSAEEYQNDISKTDPLTATTQGRRDIYGRDNARRRDIWNHHFRLPGEPRDFLSEDNSDDE